MLKNSSHTSEMICWCKQTEFDWSKIWLASASSFTLAGFFQCSEKIFLKVCKQESTLEVSHPETEAAYLHGSDPDLI